jgi:hypothetical protein
MKNIFIVIVIIIIIILGFKFINQDSSIPADTTVVDTSIATSTSTDTGSQTADDKNAPEVVIGTSVGGKDIKAYRFGTGETELLFVGGIHGGYEWNTSLVAYELMDYIRADVSIIPENIKVTFIPVVNPDGLSKVVASTESFKSSDVSSSQTEQVAGRFNGNNVDLNRNFDCDWQATAKWQNKDVSGGSSAFSEPESQAVRNYIEKNNPKAVVVWYSAAGGVYSSSCHNGVSAETSELTKVFAKASGYPGHEDFDFYEITGDMVNWLAKNNIPAISVLLTNHTDTELSKNKAGFEAVLKSYSK